MKSRLRNALLVALVAPGITWCGCGASPTAPAAVSSGSGTGSDGVAGESEETVFSGAGDIADGKYLANAAATADVLRALPGPRFTAGDTVQDSGALFEYLEWWGPTWGAVTREIHPTIGNHDRGTAYFDYFGWRAGPPGLGYYSYDLGRRWHVLSLNSNDASAASGTQYAWVAQDLASNTRPCTIAIWHHPTVSAGPSGGDGTMEHVRRLLYRAGGEIVINGHNHVYERMLPTDDAYRRDEAHGLVQFVVGTGGYPLYEFTGTVPHTAFRFNQDHGVLSLTLRAGRYDWQFLTVKSGVVDSGSGTCHGAPAR